MVTTSGISFEVHRGAGAEPADGRRWPRSLEPFRASEDEHGVACIVWFSRCPAHWPSWVRTHGQVGHGVAWISEVHVKGGRSGSVHVGPWVLFRIWGSPNQALMWSDGFLGCGITLKNAVRRDRHVGIPLLPG